MSWIWHPGGAGAGVGETRLQNEAGQHGGRRGAELPRQALAVRVDRARADPQGGRDLLGRHALRDADRDLTLPTAERHRALGNRATSGDYEHYYQIDGRRYAHLIVPRTGRTARGVLATTVVRPRGEWSDGLSAALFLIGPARGSAVADSLPGIAAVWVRDEGTARVRRSAVVHSARARHWFHFDAALPEL